MSEEYHNEYATTNVGSGMLELFLVPLQFDAMVSVRGSSSYWRPFTEILNVYGQLTSARTRRQDRIETSDYRRLPG